MKIRVVYEITIDKTDLEGVYYEGCDYLETEEGRRFLALDVIHAGCDNRGTARLADRLTSLKVTVVDDKALACHCVCGNLFTSHVADDGLERCVHCGCH